MCKRLRSAPIAVSDRKVFQSKKGDEIVHYLLSYPLLFINQC